jgi:hypothetical protein
LPPGPLDQPLRLACFVTPHGFGHAARACAVLAAVGRRVPLAVELFTTVPEWFFRESLAVPFAVHPLRCDVGLVQHDAMSEDLPATVRELADLVPFSDALLSRLATAMAERRCDAVMCDVAPLGIAAARRAGLPVALVENFTWDWIYEAYVGEEPRLAPFAERLARWFARADLRLQTTPVCRAAPGAVTVPPVARRRRRPAAEVRALLGLGETERAVLVTMGGISWDFAALAPRLPPGVVLLVPGGSREGERRAGSALLMPFHSRFHHPDLVAASDAVVGKLGYSTFAEAWSAGTPFGFIPRSRFPESRVLGDFVTTGGAGVAIPARALDGVDWDWLPALLALPRREPGGEAGDDAAALALLRYLATAGVVAAAPGAG